MAVTIRDVADAAGVSIATASRALSGSRRVSPDLAARVLEAARALGYRHNVLARALRRGRTNTVGMIVPEIANPFFPAIVEAVERRLQETGRDLFLCDAQLDPEIERHRVLALVGRQVDGLIIAPVSAVESRASLVEAVPRIPVVQLDRYVADFEADWVGVDDEIGMRLVTEHVAAAGARRYVFVSSRPESSAARQRGAGLDAAAASAGLEVAVPHLLGTFSAEWGKQAAAAILGMDEKPDAVICGNDEIAMGILSELRRNQVRIPEDVLVTGFDDVRFAALTDPPLTTVHQPRERMALECIRLLDARIADPTSEVLRIALAPTLVVRESTGGRS